MASTIIATKRQRVLNILDVQGIPESGQLYRRYRTILATLVGEGIVKCVAGVFYSANALIELDIPEVDAQGVRPPLTAPFAQAAQALHDDLEGDGVVFFRVNNGVPFPVHVENLRRLLDAEACAV